MPTPLISVIVPTFRRHELLAACLRCLAPGVQTLAAEQYEVIVGDDGHSAAASLSATFPWVRWWNGPQRGPAANRNSAAAQAHGSWLAFTDDDCLPTPGWLAAWEAARVPGSTVYEGKTTCAAGVHSPLQHAPINLTGGWLWSCNFCVAKELFHTTSGFDERFPFPHMEDVEFKERVQQKTTITFVPEAVVDHPPRVMASGRQLAKYHESWVYYQRLHGRNFSTAKLLSDVLRARLQAVRRHRWTVTSFQALGSMVQELGGILRLAPGWQRKYRTVR